MMSMWGSINLGSCELTSVPLDVGRLQYGDWLYLPVEAVATIGGQKHAMIWNLK
jgi:hypothetical protein